MSSTKKQLKDLAKRLEPHGLHIVTGSGHNKIVGANGRFMLTFSGSPGALFWQKEVIRDLRRYHGIVV